MSTKALAGFIAVIVVLCVIVYFVQKSGPGASSAGPNAPGAKLPPQPKPGWTEASLQRNWHKLIAPLPAPPLGNKSAPYTVIEIGDFQCPSCGMSEPLLLTMIKASDGQAKLYFDNWPLTRIHPHAMIAAEAGESAAAQGKFWQMYQLLYAHQDELIDSEIEYDARSIPGMNTHQLQQDLTTQRWKPVVQKQIAFINALKAVSTPTFLVRGPDGHISWYTGLAPKGTVGLAQLSEKPPWGHALPASVVDAIVKQAQQKVQDQFPAPSQPS